MFTEFAEIDSNLLVHNGPHVYVYGHEGTDVVLCDYEGALVNSAFFEG